jgi:hypothetical protein
MDCKKMSTKPISMSDKRYDELVSVIRTTYPHACVLWIEEISNPTLEEHFSARYESMIQSRGDDISIQQLYHGTSEDCMKNIIVNGFQGKYNKVGAYGKGTYFSPQATMSAQYSKSKKNQISFMFVCNVIVGICKIGSSMAIKTDDMDNYVNHLKNPSIICCPFDDMAVPKYVIAFHREAKF